MPTRIVTINRKIDKETMKLWYIHKICYYLAIKEKELLLHITGRMKLKNLTLETNTTL